MSCFALTLLRDSCLWALRHSRESVRYQTPIGGFSSHFRTLVFVLSSLYFRFCTSAYILTIPPSTSAPPLTVENVLQYLPEVKNWKEVGEVLLSLNEAKVQAIEKEYSSSEGRMRAVVQQWLEGGGLSLSWRWLVSALDFAGDIQVADPIRGFTEPPPGESS